MVLITDGNKPNEHRLVEAYNELKAKHSDRLWHELVEGLQQKQFSPAEFSVKHCFDHLVEGGRDIRKSWEHAGRGGFRLVEGGVSAVTTSAFTNVFGQVIYTTFLDSFKQPNLIGDELFTTRQTKFKDGKKSLASR